MSSSLCTSVYSKVYRQLEMRHMVNMTMLSVNLTTCLFIVLAVTPPSTAMVLPKSTSLQLPVLTADQCGPEYTCCVQSTHVQCCPGLQCTEVQGEYTCTVNRDAWQLRSAVSVLSGTVRVRFVVYMVHCT